MRLSARNALKGTVTRVEKGAVNSTVAIGIGGGTIVTAMITNAAVEDLGLAEGKPVLSLRRRPSSGVAGPEPARLPRRPSVPTICS